MQEQHADFVKPAYGLTICVAEAKKYHMYYNDCAYRGIFAGFVDRLQSAKILTPGSQAFVNGIT